MDSRSVFFDEWLRSLREQYKHVVRNNDMVTLPTLTAVMQNVGFREDELTQLRIEATMHVDDVPDQFAPDMKILDPVPASQPHSAECLCPQCMTIDEAAHDAEGQPIVPEPDAATAAKGKALPAAIIEPAEDDEPDPLTFEDSLDVDAGSEDVASEAQEIAEDESADADPDAPAQMSLF